MAEQLPTLKAMAQVRRKEQASEFRQRIEILRVMIQEVQKVIAPQPNVNCDD